MRSSLALAIAALSLLSARSSTATAPGDFPWQKPPGPIAGKWQTTCSYPNFTNMTIDIAVSGKTATGRIAVLGDGGKRGYKEGEQILQLTADDFGDWVGKLHWRQRSGLERQDPIRMVAKPDVLDATMTTDPCYKSMPRAR